MECVMDWSMVIALIATNVTLAGIFIAVLIWTFCKLDSDIKGLAGKIDSSTSRIDNLYQMFIDLLKDNRRTDP